jgi:homoserine dehydrogenase
MIPEKRLIANVHGVMNAVLVEGDAVGPTMYYGAGAGAEPTASAVVADIVDLVRDMSIGQNVRMPSLAFQQDAMSDMPILPMEQVVTAYYLRITVAEKPGVLAQITQILGAAGISIEAIQQQTHGSSQVPVIILTRPVQEGKMNAAIESIEALADVNGSVTRIRVENLDG